MDTQSRAITAIMLAIGVVICGVLYSVLDVSYHPATTVKRPYPYTTLPYDIPPYVTTPDDIIDFGNPFDLGPGITNRDTSMPVPPTVGDYPQPVAPPRTTTTTLLPLLPLLPPVQTPPITIPTEGINKSICENLPSLCDVTALLDKTVDSTTNTVDDTIDGVNKIL